MDISISRLLFLAAVIVGSDGWTPPRPDARQADFMELELSQFMHFGVSTFWNPPQSFLRSQNPTYHNCYTTSVDHSNQTGKHWPCLAPELFYPTALDAEDWMRSAKAMGTREICLTAAHEGGFALWPSNFTRYSVAASRWRGGKGNVLREFADAANKFGIKICYYLQVSDDGWGMHFGDINGKTYTAASFLESMMGRLTEVLTEYGPVSRFWFDGAGFAPNFPKGLNETVLWQNVYERIRTLSPSTLISPKRGDICQSNGGRYSLYVNDGPEPNTTDTRFCTFPNASGRYFTYLESHGVTIQEGPDGNSDALPTYWFWHEWACAGNISGCPWIGHSNASRLFGDYLGTVGHGTHLIVNIPPDRTGRMNASVRSTMAQFGAAITQTFGHDVFGRSTYVGSQRLSPSPMPSPAPPPITGNCVEGFVTIRADGFSPSSFTSASTGGPILMNRTLPPFDYVMTMEELGGGQRIANYSIEYLPAGSSGKRKADWKVLVPAGGDNPYPSSSPTPMPGKPLIHSHKERLRRYHLGRLGDLGDPIAGHFKRDQHIGHKRIDIPVVPTQLPGTIAAVRFSCLRAYAEPVALRSFSLHRRCAPWDRRGCPPKAE